MATKKKGSKGVRKLLADCTRVGVYKTREEFLKAELDTGL